MGTLVDKIIKNVQYNSVIGVLGPRRLPKTAATAKTTVLRTRTMMSAMTAIATRTPSLTPMIRIMISVTKTTSRKTTTTTTTLLLMQKGKEKVKNSCTMKYRIDNG